MGEDIKQQTINRTKEFLRAKMQEMDPMHCMFFGSLEDMLWEYESWMF